MATRHALRLVQRRFSSSGKALSHEEKASENIFVKGSHLKPPTMATKHALRLVQHRFSSSGKVLSEEEKDAENVFSKKTQQEMLEKLARKQAEYNELAQRFEALKKENASLRAEALKEERFEALKKENASLRAEALKEEIASLKEEVNRIRSKYEELHVEHELTKDSYDNIVFMFAGMLVFIFLVG